MKMYNGCYTFESHNGKSPVCLSKTQSKRLLHCPYCGTVPEIEPWHGGGPKKHFIGCVHNGCPVTPQCTGETLQKALGAWNTRY